MGLVVGTDGLLKLGMGRLLGLQRASSSNKLFVRVLGLVGLVVSGEVSLGVGLGQLIRAKVVDTFSLSRLDSRAIFACARIRLIILLSCISRRRVRFRRLSGHFVPASFLLSL